MSKKAPTMEELVQRPVVRQLIDSEWMSKMSSKEFRQWEENERMTFLICKYPKYEHDAKLQQQIEFKEMEYKLRKEQVLERKEKSKAVDKSLNEHTQEILEILDNGITKYKGNNICLGGDLVNTPGVAEAVLTASTKTNKNGRIYNPKSFDLKDHYNAGRLDGTFNHPDVIIWDKYEKHVKKYGI